MKYRILLLKDRIPFLLQEIPENKIKVFETDNYGMTDVELTIDDSFDLLKIFHVGELIGKK